MAEATDPQVETPAGSAPASGEPTAPPAEGGTTTPDTSTDPVQPESKKEPWLVPGERVQELAAKNKELELKMAELERARTETQPEGERLDPEAERLLKSAGFMTRAEIEAAQAEIRGELQLQTDLQELKSKYPDFDSEKVLEFARDNGLKNKTGLEAAYTFLNREKLLEDAHKRGIAEANGVGVAEKPDAGGAKQPPAPELKGSSREMLKQALDAVKSGGQ